METMCRFLQQTLADAEQGRPAADHAAGGLGERCVCELLGLYIPRSIYKDSANYCQTNNSDRIGVNPLEHMVLSKRAFVKKSQAGNSREDCKKY